MLDTSAPNMGGSLPCPIVTIHFEDHGQDFLKWDCAEDGSVIGCRPFQGWLWCQGRVTNLNQLAVPGDRVEYESGMAGLIVIAYPIAELVPHE